MTAAVVEQWLAELGKTPVDIADSLRQQRIKGRRCVADDCPLARYLNKRINSLGFSVGKFFVYFSGSALFSLSGPLYDFRDLFDHRQFMDLIDGE